MDERKRIPLNIPDIGEAEKIEIVSWYVRPGERVNADQELCEIVTDKAAFPLESPEKGVIEKILAGSGATVRIGETVAVLTVDTLP
jgi:pyruvate/2-oxoglutarate dehydrogenase complex dihydrolipoamide acyltransferase (E2) component